MVAERLVAPARKPDNEIALAATPGGFGTPPFELRGSRLQVRVEGDELVLDRDGAVERAPLDGLAAGAALLGPALLPAGPPADAALDVDPAAARSLAELYAFAAELLGALRAELPEADDPSPIILWPEHFDIAFEAGAEDRGLRANYGVSPGDAGHPEPYVYVGPWSAETSGELWNATGFNGAELGYDELVGAADPRALALAFLRSRRAALSG